MSSKARNIGFKALHCLVQVIFFFSLLSNKAKPRNQLSQWTPLKTSIDLSQYEVRTTLKQSPNMNWLESMKTLIEYQEFLRNFQYVKGTDKQDGKYDHFTYAS